jgi:hypothetical protein
LVRGKTAAGKSPDSNAEHARDCMLRFSCSASIRHSDLIAGNKLPRCVSIPSPCAISTAGLRGGPSR